MSIVNSISQLRGIFSKVPTNPTQSIPKQPKQPKLSKREEQANQLEAELPFEAFSVLRKLPEDPKDLKVEDLRILFDNIDRIDRINRLRKNQPKKILSEYKKLLRPSHTVRNIYTFQALRPNQLTSGVIYENNPYARPFYTNDYYSERELWERYIECLEVIKREKTKYRDEWVSRAGGDVIDKESTSGLDRGEEEERERLIKLSEEDIYIGRGDNSIDDYFDRYESRSTKEEGKKWLEKNREKDSDRKKRMEDNLRKVRDRVAIKKKEKEEEMVRKSIAELIKMG